MTNDEALDHWVGEIKRQLIDLKIGPDLGLCPIGTRHFDFEAESWTEAEAAIRQVLEMALNESVKA